MGDENESALKGVVFFQLAAGGEVAWRTPGEPSASIAAVAGDGADVYLEGAFTGVQLLALANIMARALH